MLDVIDGLKEKYRHECLNQEKYSSLDSEDKIYDSCENKWPYNTENSWVFIEFFTLLEFHVVNAE